MKSHLRALFQKYFFMLIHLLALSSLLSACDSPVLQMDASTKLREIQVTCEQNRIPKSVSLPCEAVGLYSDGTVQNITSEVSWSTSDPTIVTSSTKIKSSWIRGLTTGSSDVIATLGSISGSYRVMVTTANPVSLSVTPTNQVLPTGFEQVFSSICVFSDNSVHDVTHSSDWESHDPTVATAEVVGVNSALVKAKSVGNTSIQANFGGISGITAVTVLNKMLQSIDIVPSNSVTLVQGLSVDLNVIGTYTDFTTVDLTNLATWSTLDSHVALASNNSGSRGRLSAQNAGSTRVQVTYAGLTSSVDVTVVNPILTGIVLTPANSSVAMGMDAQLMATGYYSDGTTMDISEFANWTSSSTIVATVSNVSHQRGKVKGQSTGVATITASMNGFSGQTSITVTAAELASVAITPSLISVPLGASQAMSATGIYTDGSTVDLTSSASWSSSNAAVATVNGAGVVNALALGSVTVSGSVAGKVGQSTITVGPAVLVSLTLSAPSGSVAKGLTLQYTAMGTYSDGTTADLSSSVGWGTSNPSVVTISNTVGSKGLATGAGVGTANVIATLNGVTKQSVVTIAPAILQSILVSASGSSLAKGLTLQYTAMGTYSDGTTADISSAVNWTSSDASVASVGNIIGTKGLVTAVTVGSANIVATLGLVTHQLSLSITPAILQSVLVTASGSSLAKGLTLQYTATGTYSDGTTADLSSGVTWGTSNSSVATVSNAGGTKGLVTGVAIGSAMVTATLGSVTYQASLSITPAILQSVSVTSSASSLAKGLTLQYTATGTYSDGTTSDLTSLASWGSSDPSVISVGNVGLAKGLVLAVGLGTANIIATVGVSSSQTAIIITAPALQSIAVTGTLGSLAKGLTRQYTATGTYSDGSTSNITSLVSWSTVNASVATVGNVGVTRGLATAAGVGTTDIVATLGLITGHVSVQVSAATLVSIAVTPENSTIVILLQTRQMTATGTYTDGTTADITKQVTWTSSNHATATINNDPGCEGEAWGLAFGTTTIRATAPGGVFGFTQLNGILF